MKDPDCLTNKRWAKKHDSLEPKTFFIFRNWKNNNISWDLGTRGVPGSQIQIILDADLTLSSVLTLHAPSLCHIKNLTQISFTCGVAFNISAFWSPLSQKLWAIHFQSAFPALTPSLTRALQFFQLFEFTWVQNAKKFLIDLADTCCKKEVSLKWR